MITTINGVEIKLTTEQIQKVLEAQKLVKTKEDRFKELIEGIEINKPVVDFEKFPTSIFWFKGDKLYFEYNWKSNFFWVNWSLVWRVFEKEYNMKYSDIQAFMKIMVEEHFKLKGVIPVGYGGASFALVEEHFKLKGVIPRISS